MDYRKVSCVDDDDSDQLVIPLDHVLSIVSLYWYTETISSSMRLYYENGQTGFLLTM